MRGSTLGLRKGFLRSQSDSGTSEASRAARGLVHGCHGLPLPTAHRGDDNLRDSVATVNDKGFVAEIDKDDPYLAAVVGVDGSRRIDQGDAYGSVVVIPRGKSPLEAELIAMSFMDSSPVGWTFSAPSKPRSFISLWPTLIPRESVPTHFIIKRLG